MARTRIQRGLARRLFYSVVAVASAILLVPGDAVVLAQEATPAPAPKLLPPDQLDALVAPIALYPDSLLAQTLAAATYPLEIIQLQQWMAKNPNLKDKALADAVGKQPWDPSVQSMAAFPDVLKRLGDDVQWTTDLGNAFLAQQSDVMDACQRLRKKAKDTGTLTSNEQQKVETQVIEKKEVIVIQPSQPDVIYVPSYDPVVVYGAPVYPYPPIYYPYYPVGAAFVSFGVGFAMGAFWGGVWGVILTLTLPRWFSGAAYWIAALVAGGVALTLVFMFVVWPLKVGGFPPNPGRLFVIGFLLNAAWGLGWALFLRWFERMRR